MPGKYQALYEYLEHRYANTVVLTFAQIEARIMPLEGIRAHTPNGV
jgi:hypothetical protein